MGRKEIPGVPGSAGQPQLANGRWMRGHDDLAVKIEAADLPGGEAGVRIEPGLSGVLGDGKPAGRGSISLSGFWARFLGRAHAEVTLVADEAVPLQTAVTGLHDHGGQPLRLEVSGTLQITDAPAFVAACMDGRRRFDRADLAAVLAAAIQPPARSFLADYIAADLMADQTLLGGMEARLQQDAGRQLERHGIGVEGLTVTAVMPDAASGQTEDSEQAEIAASPGAATGSDQPTAAAGGGPLRAMRVVLRMLALLVLVGGAGFEIYAAVAGGDSFLAVRLLMAVAAVVVLVESILVRRESTNDRTRSQRVSRARLVDQFEVLARRAQHELPGTVRLLRRAADGLAGEGENESAMAIRATASELERGGQKLAPNVDIAALLKRSGRSPRGLGPLQQVFEKQEQLLAEIMELGRQIAIEGEAGATEEVEPLREALDDCIRRMENSVNERDVMLRG